MKGLKKLCCGLLLALFIMFGLSLNASADVSAANLSTVSFDMFVKYDSSFTDYQWSNNIPFNSFTVPLDVGGGILKYRINTGTVTAGADYGLIHFETNIVAESLDYGSWDTWYHLDYQNLITCASSQSGVVIKSKNLSYAVTNWTHLDSNTGTPYMDSTLTFYGDVVLKGFTANSPVYFTCEIGSNNYSFAQVLQGQRTKRIYFEQNPMTINWTNDETDSLLNIQINQNQQIINQNNQDRDDLQTTFDSNSTSAEDLADSIDSVSSSLLTIIGNFVNIIINPPARDCVIDGDTGFMDLGNIDLCQLSPPPAFSIIATLILIGFIIPFAYSLISTILSLLKGATED